MGQIHGPSLGSPAVIVTSQGELLTTGSVNVSATPRDADFITINQTLREINNKMTIIINHMELINNTTIKEVETEE